MNKREFKKELARLERTKAMYEESLTFCKAFADTTKEEIQHWQGMMIKSQDAINDFCAEVK